MSDVAREKGGKPKNEKKSFGRQRSFQQRQKSFSHDTSQKRYEQSRSSKLTCQKNKPQTFLMLSLRGYLGKNFIPGFSWKKQQQQQQQQQQKQAGKPWQKKKSWKKKNGEEER